MTDTNEIEYKIISTFLLCDDGDIRKKLSCFTKEHFSDNTAARIYEKIINHYNKFPNADYSAFFHCLERSEMETVAVKLEEMMSAEIAEMHVDDTVSLFHENYVQKILKSSVLEIGMSNHVSLSDIAALAQKAESLSQKRKNSALNYIQNYDKKFEFIPTKFTILDNLLNGGFIKGTLAAVGARPSTGKTTFALNIAAHNPDKKTLFFSIEMTARMIYDRLVSERANVDYSLSGLHKIPVDTVKSVLNIYQNLTVIDDMPCAEDISEMILYEKPDFVVIDFIQIVTSRKNFPDIRQRIDYISNLLKLTAKKTNCCILILSQLTRAGKEKPTMSDLKESGGLEQDSDYVILIHRPYVLDKKNPEFSPEQTDVILDKNKFGSTKELPYQFEGKYQRFSEIPEKPVAHMKKTNEKGGITDDLPF